MKYLHFTIALLFGAMTFIFAQNNGRFQTDHPAGPSPWTNLDFQNDPENFQFAIVTDRTGSPRPGVFEDAVKKLNWLMPEFVMSVGDLIQGNSPTKETISQEWVEFEAMVAPLKMPFFHLAGNHDIKPNRPETLERWEELFGRPYYYYRYKDVLFLAIFSNDLAPQTIGQEQLEYFQKVLDDNKDVRWTMVFLHHPLWIYKHLTNFGDLEAMLKDRKHTVFAGHIHRYIKFERENANYYTLATTGGGSGLLGNTFGQFDQVTWVTMTDDGPILANLRLDGILPDDVATPASSLLGSSLAKSARFETLVFTNPGKEFEKAKVFLTISNGGGQPLSVDTKFFHHHYLKPSIPGIKEVIEPMGKKTFAIEIETEKSFPVEEKMMLELTGSVSYDLEKLPGLSIDGTTKIVMEQTEFDVIPTEKAVFVNKHQLELTKAIPGTHIRYTLDGTEPSMDSPKYDSPITIDKKCEIKARLFTDDGMASNLDVCQLEPISAGKGLICDYFEYSKESRGWSELPDFSKITPLVRKIVSEVDIDKHSPKVERYGLFFHGMVDMPEAGTYTFEGESDDAIRLVIDGKEALADTYKHKARAVNGTVELKKGKQSFELHYFQHRKEKALNISFTTPSGKKMSFTPEQFSFGQTEKSLR